MKLLAMVCTICSRAGPQFGLQMEYLYLQFVAIMVQLQWEQTWEQQLEQAQGQIVYW